LTKVEEIGRVCENNRKRLDEVRREVKEIKEKIYLLSLGKEKVKVIIIFCIRANINGYKLIYKQK
jgi:hypothetical protein